MVPVWRQVVKVDFGTQREAPRWARKRRRFTAAFKGRVALEALQERDSVQAIAARHEFHPNPGQRVETAASRCGA